MLELKFGGSPVPAGLEEGSGWLVGPAVGSMMGWTDRDGSSGRSRFSLLITS